LEFEQFGAAGTAADLFDPICHPLPNLTGRQTGFWKQTCQFSQTRPFLAFVLPIEGLLASIAFRPKLPSL
jgi:hypothetical protein